jgi:small-conductance mechanosensitive channel
MNLDAVWSNLAGWSVANGWQLGITGIVLLGYILFNRFTAPRLAASADQGRFKEDAGDNAIRIARRLSLVVCALALAIVWGEFASVLVFAGTALTLLGVALFASWSLLSNITAYFILMLHPAFRRGTFIRILDADNYLEGYVADLNLFSVRLITENREVAIYPNNLILGRPCLINPRDRLAGVGKLSARVEPAETETRITATATGK